MFEGLFEPIKQQLNCLQFNHLNDVNQNYTDHFKDSMSYSWNSAKGAFYFFCHGIYPDAFKTNGSETITDLNNVIQRKMSNINDNNCNN